MATNFVAKLPTPYTYCSVIPKRNGILPSGMRINSSTNRSKSCEKMVKIGSVVFELTWGENENCAATRPKLAYIAKYLDNY